MTKTKQRVDPRLVVRRKIKEEIKIPPMNGAEVCAFIDLNRVTFSAYCEKGIVTRQQFYDLKTVVREIFKHYKNRDRNELDHQRARASQMQADKNQFQLARELKEVVPKRLMVDTWLDLIALFNSRVVSLPKAKAPKFVRIDSAAKAEAAIRELLTELVREIVSTDPESIIAGSD